MSQMSQMNKYTIVNTNCNAGFKDSFRVHKCGCQDVAKEVKRCLGNSWTVTATSAEDAIASEVQEFDSMDMGYTRDDFYVCNCARR